MIYRLTETDVKADRETLVEKLVAIELRMENKRRSEAAIAAMRRAK